MISEVLVPGLDSSAADNKISNREFLVGDMVYLKLQPSRHHALNLHQHLRLATKYYGPFRVLERVGPATYRIQLPSNVDVHPIFHVSQPKNM
jgi:hypothetical protein